MPQIPETNQNSNEPQEELKILITGDKPKNLLARDSQAASLAYSRKMSDTLEIVSERALNQIIKDKPGKKIVLLSGLELGTEQSAARRAAQMGIEVKAFIPHKEHGKNWSGDFQKQYQELIAEITEKGGTIQGSDKEYSPQRVQLRDFRMVDEAQIILSLHNPNEKPPAHQKTLDYAAKHSKPVHNIWNDAEKLLSEVSKNFDNKETQNPAEIKLESAEKTIESAVQKSAPTKIEIRERITRENVRAERDKIFLFGDNLKQTGYGGQAKEMRGEQNALGIPTKKEPANNRESFFTDREFGANIKAIDEAFGRIPPGKTIVIPRAGIGTGLARLSEKAPRTFAYLNEKLAEIGFDNRRGKTIVAAPNNENKVIVQIPSEKAATNSRLLDLNNIQTNELKLLSPAREEVDALEINRREALSNYAERLRQDYKENKNGLREGLKSVNDALRKGEQITVACNCRNGEMCHADVVKMAIEKINLHIKNQKIQETNRSENDSRNVQVNDKTDSQKPEHKINPRTQRAIAEILGTSETDKLLETINQTDGRNQSEQASHLGKFSQFVRDVYERGGNVVDGKLIVPKENLSLAPPLLLTTQDYAIKKLGDVLKDESKAKEIAPNLIEYGNYAAKLEAAATRNEIIKASSDVRAENAALGMKWKDLETSEKEKLARPITNREMQFLFTETSPAHYTPEMTVARLAYAHSGASRRQMTEALLKGEIKPSPEAKKLIDSLESRLQRRELKDSMLATKHFFESLKTSNENLKYKNNFDHQEIYRQLPPQERDFVYTKTTRQKENLEYRLAFKQQELVRDNSVSRDSSPKLQQSQIEKRFHLLSGFNQGRILGERVETSPLASTEISERDFRAANVILQNQPQEKISNLGQELKQSEAVEERKIGEILETFSQAEITKSSDKTTIEIRLPENALVGAKTYEELLERFYPDDERENDKFKFSNFNQKTLHNTRTKGQDASLKTLQTELGNNFYAAETTVAQVFQTERALTEDLSCVGQMQQSARAARTENAQILGKYASRAALKIENQKLAVPNIAEQKQIVKAALDLSSKDANPTAVNLINRQFFASVQQEISVSDFQRFAANEKIIAENKTSIRKAFSEINVKQNALEESRIKPADIRAADKLAEVYLKTQTQEENRLTTRAARTAFERDLPQNLERKSIEDLVSQTEKQAIKNESATKARIAVEPENKYFEEKESEPQALKLADAIGRAHDLSKAGAPPSEVAEALETAENERTILLEANNGVKKSEDKPLSLRLYEAEIKRAEKEVWTKSLGAKILAGVSYSESELTLNLDEIFSAPEREQMKIESAEIAKSRLEPKELGADHRKIPTEAGRQALKTFKQLEQAHNIYQFSNDFGKIREAFAKLDQEATTLNKFRQDYNKTEKLALLREGVKSDLADLLRKNQNLNGGKLQTQTSEILRQNFAKTGLSNLTQSERQTEILSREISGKIESKQIETAKENANLSNRSPQPFERSAAQEKQIDIHAAKDQKAKESFVLTR